MWPFWADGGSGPGDPVLAPRGHVLAAYPTSIRALRLEDLGPGGLVPFLRTCLPPASDAALPLVVLLLGYDAGRAAAGHENLFARPARAVAHPHDEFPDVLVANYAGYLEAPSELGPWTAVGDTTRLEAALEAAPIEGDGAAIGALRDPLPPGRYFAAVAAILEGIAAGDFYQVNLARRLVGDVAAPAGDANALMRAAARLHAALRDAQPTAFGALMPLGERAWLVSGSPECLLEWQSRTRRAASFPIKGTLGRGDTPHDDHRLGEELRASAKDRAEHVMIVDLVRNDLGRAALPGRVSVPAILSELSLRTVRHLVSEVRAEIDPARDLADLIGALFPGGSITGAPKIAAMKSLDKLESFHRGFYCGSLGVIRGGLRATLSILIRTAVLSDDGLTYSAGGGIVADSEATLELAETELKTSAMDAAIDRARARVDRDRN